MSKEGRTPQPEEMNIQKRLLKEKQPRPIEDIAKDLGIGMDVLVSTINELKESGYGVRSDGDIFLNTNTPLPEGRAVDLRKRFDDKYLHFGVISDTHMSSKHERVDALEQMYDVFEKEGITTVFHAGDISDGVDVYRGHHNELKHHNQSDQIQYVVDNYPKRDGIQTYFITGNHDLRAFERGGADPGKQIATARKDLSYLGQMSARVQLPGDDVELELLHPAGGSSYALSYKAQRDINNRSPQDIPDVLVYGHYHTSFYMHYRNLDFLQAPSFKENGQFETRLGLHSTIGGWLVDAKIGDNGKIARFQPELQNFDTMKK